MRCKSFLINGVGGGVKSVRGRYLSPPPNILIHGQTILNFREIFAFSGQNVYILTQFEEIMQQYWTKSYYIYALADPSNHIVRYVGKTNGPIELRYAAHARGKEPTTGSWVSTLMAPPILIVLERGADAMVPRKGAPGSMWASSVAEIKWIKRFRRTIINRFTARAYQKTWDWFINPNDEVRRDGPAT